MILANTLQVLYRGSGIHEIRQIGKAKALGNLTYTENRQLAEYAVRVIDLENKVVNSGLMINALPNYHRYLQTLHRKYESDLRENHFVQPEIDDETAAEYLFRDQILEELEKIQKSEIIDIRL